MGTGVSFSRVKQPEREVDHSPPCSAEVKNEWSYTSSPIICVHGVDTKCFIFVCVICINVYGGAWLAQYID
jgi:hypothetical protein